jgi:hypothetical protein
MAVYVALARSETICAGDVGTLDQFVWVFWRILAVAACVFVISFLGFQKRFQVRKIILEPYNISIFRYTGAS